MDLGPTQGDENRRETRSLAMEFKGRATLRLVIPTEAYPDFLLRSTGDGHVCGFKESRMRFVNANKLDRKSGERGGGICGSLHPAELFLDSDFRPKRSLVAHSGYTGGKPSTTGIPAGGWKTKSVSGAGAFA
jgi:hypothetical protein